jgi:C4-dicarboxylate-specific signal transduction histidine kinase
VNAGQAIGEVRDRHVTVRVNPESRLVTIQDDGSGISRDILRLAFFYEAPRQRWVWA